MLLKKHQFRIFKSLIVFLIFQLRQKKPKLAKLDDLVLFNIFKSTQIRHH